MASTPGVVLYPAALDDDDSLIRTADNVSVHLLEPLGAGDTEAVLTTSSAAPPTGAITFGREVVRYTGNDTGTGTLSGLIRTAPEDHPPGEVVELRATSILFSTLRGAIVATQGKLGIGASAPEAGQFLKGTGPGASTWEPLTGPEVIGALGYTPQDAASAATDQEIADAVAAAVDPINTNLATLNNRNLSTPLLGGFLVGAGAGSAAWMTTNAIAMVGGQLGINNPAPGAMLHVSSGGVGVIPLIAQGGAAQTGNLQEWRNSAGAALTVVDATGRIGVNRSTTIPSMIFVSADAAATQVATFRGAASQTATLTGWQDSTGVLLSSVSSVGNFGIGVAASASIVVSVQTRNIADTGIRVRAIAGQTGDLQTWTDSGGVTLSRVNASGQVGILTAPSGTYPLTVGSVGDYTTLSSGLAVFTAFMGGASGNQWGIFSDASQNVVSTGTYVGMASRVRVSATGALASGHAYRANSPVITAGGIITTAAGFHAQNMGLAAIDTSYGLLVDAQSGAAIQSFAIVTNGGETRHLAGTATTIPLVVRAATSQSANLQEWQNISGVVLASVGPLGTFAFTTTITATSGTAIGYSGSLTLNPSGASTASGRGIDILVISQSGNAQNVTNLTGTRTLATHSSGGTAATVYAVNPIASTGASAGNVTTAMAGVLASATHASTLGTVGSLYGVSGDAIQNAGAGNVSVMYGGIFTATANATVTTAHGVRGAILVGAAGVVSNSYTLRAFTPTVTAGGTITNQYGLQVENQGAAGITTSYGIRVLAQSGASSASFAIFTDGGTVEHRAGVATTIPLVVAGAASQTGNLQEWRNSGGTALNAIGPDGVLALGGIATSTAAGYKLYALGTPASNGMAIIQTQGTATSTTGTTYGIASLALQGVTTTGGIHALYGRVGTTAAITLPTAITLYANSPQIFAASAITIAYGLRVENQGAPEVGTAYGIYVTNQTGATTANYAIYTTGGQVRHDAGTATVVPLAVRGTPSQSANLQEWQNSSGTLLANVDPQGMAQFGSGSIADTSGTRRGVYNPTVLNYPSDSSLAWRGIQSNITFSSGAVGNFTGTAYAVRGDITYSAPGTASALYGVYGSLIVGATAGALATVAAVQATVTHGGPGVITSGRAVEASISASNATGSYTSAYGLYVVPPSLTGGATVGTVHGLFIGNQGHVNATNAYGILISNIANATNSNYAIWTLGGTVRHESGAAGVVPLVARGAASQTANLQEWQNSSSTVLASVGPDGKLTHNLPNTIAWLSVATFSGGGNGDLSGATVELRTSGGVGPGLRIYGGRWSGTDRGTRLVGINSAGTERSYVHVNAEGDAVQLASSGGVKLEIGATGIGFFGGAQAAKPAITGSRGGNAALAALLTALAGLGLLTDSTTA